MLLFPDYYVDLFSVHRTFVVFGLVLGTRRGNTVDIRTSFEVNVDIKDGGDIELDIESLSTRIRQCSFFAI